MDKVEITNPDLQTEEGYPGLHFDHIFQLFNILFLKTLTITSNFCLIVEKTKEISVTENYGRN